MNRPHVFIAGVVIVGLGLAGLGGKVVLDRLWFGPRAELEASLADARDQVDRRRRALDSADGVADVIGHFASRSLGADRETVDHELRSSVTGIARGVGLPATIVSTGRARTLETPMKRAFPRRGLYAKLREEPDLVELPATVVAEGPLGSILALIAGISEAPWPKRVASIRLDTRRGGSVVSMRMGLVTAFLPGREGPDQPAPDPVVVRPPVARALALLTAGDRFRLPAPEAPQVEAPVIAAVPDPAPAPFPWARWRLAGVASGPDGPEAWLEEQGGRTLVLTLGESLDVAALEAVRLGDAVAVFSIGTRQVRVPVGSNLGAAAGG